MNYSKFSNKEILDIHENMMDFSGKPDADLQKEIDARGGLEQVQEIVAEDNLPYEDAKAIRAEIFKLYARDPDPVAIKRALAFNRNIPDTEGHDIDGYIADISSHIENRKVDKHTYLNAGVGILVSTVICTLLWYASLAYFEKIYYKLILLNASISFGIIWLIARKDRENVVVMVAGILSAIVSTVLGLWLYRGILNN